jgi:hypothetical protein|tara:strand:+ start:962 stop:1273 length:312 start_codon:yes stop_codon:yes gene_type:complete
MLRRDDSGAYNKWDVQSAVTVGSSASATDVSGAKILGIHTDAEIYLNFSTAASAAVSTANDLKLAAGLTFINVPRNMSVTNPAVYLHAQRVGGSDVTMRLVHL